MNEHRTALVLFAVALAIAIVIASVTTWNATLSANAHYFFHIDGPRPYVDSTGSPLPNDRAAWAKACRAVREFEDYLEPGQHWQLEVNDRGTPVFIVSVDTRRR
jgi:hypothetical protein